jgi:uncharacterized protein (DUF1697 family)
VATRIALLRGINVGGRNQIPMADLRAVCVDIGWTDVQSYIQSGNLIFQADDAPADCEAELEQAIERSFGVSVPVLVRTPVEWTGYVADNPYAEVARSDPNQVMLALSKTPPRQAAVESLQARAADGERIMQIRDALWIHYAGGAGRSKLSPGVLDRLVGSAVTTRNWSTVHKLEELAGRSN